MSTLSKQLVMVLFHCEILFFSSRFTGLLVVWQKHKDCERGPTVAQP